MKHYIEQNDHWKTGKALTFLANFIRHHDKDVENNDTFAAVAELLTQEELARLVKETFPEKIRLMSPALLFAAAAAYALRLTETANLSDDLTLIVI